MTKAKSKTAGGAATNGQAGNGKPAKAITDPLELGQHASGQLDSYIDGTRDLETRIESLRRELAEAEAELQMRYRPLRQFDELLAAANGADPLDVELARACAVLEFTVRDVSVRGRDVMIPSGARPWGELIAQGTTDAQILKNLMHVDHPPYSGRTEPKYQVKKVYRGHVKGKIDYIVVFEEKSGAAHNRLLAGDKLVAAVRRVLGIPHPPKAAKTAKGAPRAAMKSPAKSKPARKSPQRKPAAKSPAKKTAAKKPATRKQPSGAQKRKARADRAAKPSPAPPADPEGEPADDDDRWAALAMGIDVKAPDWREKFAAVIDKLARDPKTLVTQLALPVRLAVNDRRAALAAAAGNVMPAAVQRIERAKDGIIQGVVYCDDVPESVQRRRPRRSPCKTLQEA